MTPGALALLVVLLFCAALAGSSLLLRLLDSPGEADVAVALGLPAGLLLMALPGWVLSAVIRVPAGIALGLSGLALAVALGTGGRAVTVLLRQRKACLAPALLGAGIFFLFLWLRWPLGAIRDTEKPMDLAVLSALLETPRLPLGDPWFAGARFSYYHFGTWLLGLPFRAAGISPEIAFNLIASLLPALLALSAYGAVRLRGGGAPLARAAALALVLAGTFDGARQLLAHGSLSGIDLWQSSRRVAGCITEWPLFTYRLGDLHPHALALPLLTALAGVAGRLRGAGGLLAEGLLLGALLATNPWDLPAALLVLAVGALMAPALPRAIGRAGLVLALSVPVVLPFALGPRPPTQGLVSPSLFTTSPEAFLHLGGFLAIPALALGIAIVRSQEKEDAAFLLAAAAPALGVALSILTGRPALGLGCAFLATVALLLPLLGGALRAGFLLASAATVLIAFPDVLVVRDSYDEAFRRMNTLFKLWNGSVPLLVLGSALLLPLVLSTRRSRVLIRALLLAVLAACLVHPAAVIGSRLRASSGGLDGLRFLDDASPGDLAVIRWLRANAAPDAVLAEAPGIAYTLHGRIAAGSGRPALLGWASHEGVWRGEAALPEIEARRADLETLFTSHDERKVREVLARRGIAYVVVGKLERALYGDDPFPARSGFRAAVSSGGTTLWEIRPR